MPDTAQPAFRISYQRYSDVRDDLAQMTKGGMLVRVSDVAGLELHTVVKLELVFPDGKTHTDVVQVLHVLAGHGVAVTVTPELVDVARRASGSDAGTAPARHERVDRSGRTERTAAPTPPTGTPKPAELSQAEKIQLALHGNRDQRNAILRDHNRVLHQYVLKNPQITTEDVLAIAKNATMAPELLKLIAERKDWFQRPQIAVALARNPKTPGEVAVRALEYCPIDALRQMAKGTGVMPHVAQAARKKVIK